MKLQISANIFRYSEQATDVWN